MLDMEPIAAGAEGAQVEELQRRLRYLGHYEGEVDGRYGDMTETAVRQFQSLSGKPDDGNVERDCWETLDREAQFAGFDPYASYDAHGYRQTPADTGTTQTTGAGQLSDDGYWRWDGTEWQPVDQAAADPADSSAAGQLSEDGHWRWDGSEWQPATDQPDPVGDTDQDGVQVARYQFAGAGPQRGQQLVGDSAPAKTAADDWVDKTLKQPHRNVSKALGQDRTASDVRDAGHDAYDLGKDAVRNLGSALRQLAVLAAAVYVEGITFTSNLAKLEGFTRGAVAAATGQALGNRHSRGDDSAYHTGVQQGTQAGQKPEISAAIKQSVRQHGPQHTLRTVWLDVIDNFGLVDGQPPSIQKMVRAWTFAT